MTTPTINTKTTSKVSVRSLTELESTGKHITGDSGYSLTSKPEWFDQSRFDSGRKYAQKYVSLVYFSYQFLLVVGLTVVRFLDVLVWSDKSSTGETSKDRYIRVFLHVHSWYVGDDIWNEISESGKSIRKVRKIHNAMGKAYNKKMKPQDGVYMSQYDMAMVQAAFVAPPILLGRALGFDESELEHWCYFWRCLGYLLGIDDEHNICNSKEQALKICYDVMYECVLPGLETPPPNFNPFWEYPSFPGKLTQNGPITKNTIMTLIFDIFRRFLNKNDPFMGPDSRKGLRKWHLLTVKVLILWLRCLSCLYPAPLTCFIKWPTN